MTILLLLWLAGVGLRITLLAVPPVIPLLHDDLQLSESAIGILSSLPTLLFALAAVPGSLLIARFGARRALIVGLLLTAIASALRGAASDAATLYVMTFLMSAGIAVMQPALPPGVRDWLPDRVGFGTAVYSNGLLVGETLSAALTIPFVLPLVSGSWRLSFQVWALPVLLTAGLMMLLAPRGGEPSRSASMAAQRRWWPDWKNPFIWLLGIILGGINSLYFATNAFLPDYLRATGHGELIGESLTALNLVQLPASFLMLAFAERLVRRRWPFIASGLLSLSGVAGIVGMPGPWTMLWAGLLGFSNAFGLILALALPPLLSPPDDVHRVSAAMFTISYPCAVIISVISGILWDTTQLPALAFAPIGACALSVVLLSPLLDFGPSHSRSGLHQPFGAGL